jgi:hypothetical protein
MNEAMKEAIEITSFRLNGCTFKEFIKANAEVDAWLIRQPGFRSRRIAERDDHTVVDILIWDTRAYGVAAAHRLMEELGSSPVHAMIDQHSVAWSVLPVRHFLDSDPAAG